MDMGGELRTRTPAISSRLPVVSALLGLGITTSRPEPDPIPPPLPLVGGSLRAPRPMPGAPGALVAPGEPILALGAEPILPRQVRRPPIHTCDLIPQTHPRSHSGFASSGFSYFGRWPKNAHASVKAYCRASVGRYACRVRFLAIRISCRTSGSLADRAGNGRTLSLTIEPPHRDREIQDQRREHGHPEVNDHPSALSCSWSIRNVIR